jgi:probable rRNA maturation factor
VNRISVNLGQTTRIADAALGSTRNELSDATVSVELSVHCDAWLAAWPDAAALAEAAARAALAIANGSQATAPLIVDVVLTDDTEQRQLNRTYRGTDAPTNVLAFAIADPASVCPLPDPPPKAEEGRTGANRRRSRSGGAPAVAPILLGDVVLAFETVEREAREQGKPLADHLTHLVVHGVLHLLGFDHQSEGEAAAMEAREVEILQGLGVPDPYRDTM